MGLRRAILAEVDKYKEKQEEIRLATKLRQLGETQASVYNATRRSVSYGLPVFSMDLWSTVAVSHIYIDLLQIYGTITSHFSSET